MGSSKAYWLVENKVVYVHNVGDLTGDDFRSVDAEIISFMRAVAQANPSEKIHVFVDNTDLSKLPKLTELEGGRILKYMKERNVGWTVVIGYKENPFLRVLSPLLTNVMGVDLKMADTVEHGLHELQKIDSNLTQIPNIEEWKQTHILQA